VVTAGERPLFQANVRKGPARYPDVAAITDFLARLGSGDEERVRNLVGVAHRTTARRRARTLHLCLTVSQEKVQGPISLDSSSRVTNRNSE